jgi:putative transposase
MEIGIRLYTHIFWSTLDCKPIITEALASIMEDHFRNEAKSMECQVIEIKILCDHVHLLMMTTPKVALQDVIKQLKGSTSHYINSHDFINEKFAFQKHYEAVSVSPIHMSEPIDYIRDNKNFHLKHSFEDECRLFKDLLRKSGLP